jgi:type I restriction enzyme S subunit
MKEGWEIKKLDEVCEVEYGTRVVRKKDGGTIHPVYGGGGATFFMDTFNRKDCLVVARFAMSEKCTRFVKGEFFLNDSGLSVKPKNTDEISQDFLNLQFLHLNDYIYSLARGTAQKNLNVPVFRKIEIHYPKSFPEQQHIVSILDKAFAAIDKAKANAEQNLKNAKELFESYLQGVFEKKGDGWAEKPLINLTTKIGSGATPRGGQKSYKTEGISLVRSMNVHNSEFRKKNLAFIDEQQAKALDNVTLQENDVLLNITGASVARCCVIPKGYLPARVNQHVSIIRANKEIIDPIFLNLLLTSKYYKDQLLFTGEQGATRQAITKAQIEVFKIDFPSLEVQKTIVQQLDALRAKTQKMEAIYQKKIADLEELKKSILQKAFAGELPSGEPAEPKTEKELV